MVLKSEKYGKMNRYSWQWKIYNDFLFLRYVVFEYGGYFQSFDGGEVKERGIVQGGWRERILNLVIFTQVQGFSYFMDVFEFTGFCFRGFFEIGLVI